MSDFLPLFLSVLLAEIGEAPQLLLAVLAMRFADKRPLFIGLFLAAAFSAGLSSVAGFGLHGVMNAQALTGFQALTLITAGFGMLFWKRKVKTLSDWKSGALFTAFVGLAASQIGDKSQFLIAASAARSGAIVVPAIAGFLAITLACVPAILFQERLGRILPINMIRWCGGAILTIAGLVLMAKAFGVAGL